MNRCCLKIYFSVKKFQKESSDFLCRLFVRATHSQLRLLCLPAFLSLFHWKQTKIWERTHKQRCRGLCQTMIFMTSSFFLLIRMSFLQLLIDRLIDEMLRRFNTSSSDAWIMFDASSAWPLNLLLIYVVVGNEKWLVPNVWRVGILLHWL